MRSFIKVVFLILIYFYSVPGISQSDISLSDPLLIKIDRKGQKKIPFDKGFVIEIPVQEEEIIQKVYGFNVFYSRVTQLGSVKKEKYFYQSVDGRKKICEYDGRVFFLEKKTIRDLEKWNSHELKEVPCGKKVRESSRSKNDTTRAIFTADLKRIDKKKYHVYIPPIPPNTLFDLVVVKRLSGSNKKKLESIFNLLYNNEEEKAKKGLIELKGKIESTPYTFPRNYFMGSALAKENNIREIIKYKQKLDKKEVSPIKLFTVKDSIEFSEFRKIYNRNIRVFHDSLNTFSYSLKDVLIDQLNNQVYRRQVDSIGANLKKFNNYYALFHSLLTNCTLQLKEKSVDRFFKGYTSLQKETKIDSTSLTKRIANLNSSINSLAQFDSLNTILSYYSTNYFNSSAPIIKQLRENMKFLVRIKKSIDKVITGDPNFVHGEWVTLQTTFPELKTEGASRIIPDFGISSINLISNSSLDQSLETYYRPFLGINLGSPINRNQQLNEIENLSLRHRVSWFLGITIGEINDANFEDFFAKQSLISGFGYRLSRSLRVATGISLVREKNQNPIISSSTVEPGAFIALSLDLELRSLFSNILTFK